MAPFFLPKMTTNTTEEKIEGLLQPLLEDSDMFLTAIRIKPTNNIKVFLDADSGLSIDKCIRINRALYKTIEEEAWYPDGNFSLEVKIPNLPSFVKRDYALAVGAYNSKGEVVKVTIPIHVR